MAALATAVEAVAGGRTEGPKPLFIDLNLAVYFQSNSGYNVLVAYKYFRCE